MRRPTILLVLTISLLGCLGQKKSGKLETLENKCEKSWQYSLLKDTIRGEVLFHATAIVLCGNVATASLTIIKTSLNDTIRILELCNTTKEFAKTSFVKIVPAQQPPFDVLLPFEKVYACQIKKTSYGIITRTV